MSVGVPTPMQESTIEEDSEDDEEEEEAEAPDAAAVLEGGLAPNGRVVI